MTAYPEHHITKDTFTDLNWKANPSSKKLLDTLVSILKEDYIQAAKSNPEIFTK